MVNAGRGWIMTASVSTGRGTKTHHDQVDLVKTVKERPNIPLQFIVFITLTLLQNVQGVPSSPAAITVSAGRGWTMMASASAGRGTPAQHVRGASQEDMDRHAEVSGCTFCCFSWHEFVHFS